MTPITPITRGLLLKSGKNPMGNTTNGQKKQKLRWDGSTMVNKFELARGGGARTLGFPKDSKKADISK